MNALTGKLAVSGVFLMAGLVPAPLALADDRWGSSWGVSINLGTACAPSRPVCPPVFCEPAGILTIDGRCFRIEDGRCLPSQVVDAFRCLGYYAFYDGCTVRVDRRDCTPRICWEAGTHCLEIDRWCNEVRLGFSPRRSSVIVVDWSWDWSVGFWRNDCHRYRGSLWHRDGSRRSFERGFERGYDRGFDRGFDRGYDRGRGDDRRDDHRGDRPTPRDDRPRERRFDENAPLTPTPRSGSGDGRPTRDDGFVKRVQDQKDAIRPAPRPVAPPSNDQRAVVRDPIRIPTAREREMRETIDRKAAQPRSPMAPVGEQTGRQRPTYDSPRSVLSEKDLLKQRDSAAKVQPRTQVQNKNRK